MSLEAVAGWLWCPVCRQGVRRVDRSMACRAGHSFDIAKQGYVNLLGKAAPANADTPSMVAARARFLGSGHYRVLADAVASRLGNAERVLEVGAGTGYYLAAALDASPGRTGLATDVSPAACRVAARAHERIGVVVADTWAGLPVRDGVLDALTCIFAPRNPAEFARVLRPGGLVVVVTPASDHLAELRERLGLLDVAPDKLADLRRTMSGFDAISTHPLTWRLRLDEAAASDAVAMGPNAFHVDATAVAASLAGAMDVTASVTLSLFRRPLPA